MWLGSADDDKIVDWNQNLTIKDEHKKSNKNILDASEKSVLRELFVFRYCIIAVVTSPLFFSSFNIFFLELSHSDVSYEPNK